MGIKEEFDTHGLSHEFEEMDIANKINNKYLEVIYCNVMNLDIDEIKMRLKYTRENYVDKEFMKNKTAVEKSEVMDQCKRLRLLIELREYIR